MKRIAPLTLACLWALTPTAHAGAPLDAGRLLAATCANCHGTDGHSAGGTESLAGIPGDTLLRKLAAFTSGEKPATIMHQIAKGYTPEQLALIAAYFAAQRPATGGIR
ncbi:MAG: cytochrome C [Proteobacteria bacterium]|nr:MAG: cytochrome C [Pseudomonadota bacterium]